MDISYPYPINIKAVWLDESTKKICWINTLKLPHEEEVICSDNPERVAQAVVNMEIRGAPAIGVAAALAAAAHALRISSEPIEVFIQKMKGALEILKKTRPTAYNLFYAISRLNAALDKASSRSSDPHYIAKSIFDEALAIYREDLEANMKIGEYGESLIPDNSTIMTHCNAGALATSAFGTALALIRVAWYRGKKIRVVATETRPVLQGARLTVYELMKEGIPVTLITDNAAGFVLRKKLVDLVVVGADRITREGFVVNKIGTYMIAIAAKRNNIPFYVAAPTSTIDPEKTIEQVLIEERSGDEVKYIKGQLITLRDVNVLNYAFDITDPDLVSAIVTEKGIVYPPYHLNIVKVLSS